jgi:hypothetical protein
MIGTVHLITPHGDELFVVEAHDHAPFVTLTVRGRRST